MSVRLQIARIGVEPRGTLLLERGDTFAERRGIEQLALAQLALLDRLLRACAEDEPLLLSQLHRRCCARLRNSHAAAIHRQWGGRTPIRGGHSRRRAG